MGGRGASIKKSMTIQQKSKAAMAANKGKVEKNPNPHLFDRMGENKKMGNTAYRKANTPRGAKSFLTMMEHNQPSNSHILGLHEGYTIAKWANQKGYKSLDRKSRADVKKILNEYARTQNPHLKAAMESKDWYWYKY